MYPGGWETESPPRKLHLIVTIDLRECAAANDDKNQKLHRSSGRSYSFQLAL